MRICVESLDLINLIKSIAPNKIYFMSQVFQEHSHCYDKRKKQGNENDENLFIFAATPSLSGQEVVVSLYVFYGSLSRPSAVQTAHAKFAKRGQESMSVQIQ